MRIKTQLYIDKYLARPLATVLNYLVRLVGQVLSIDHRLDREFSRIAVCKFKGMGSILQATPMLEALKKRFPGAEIVFVSTKGNTAILNQITTIDRIVTIDDRSFFKLIFSNIRALYDLIRFRPQVYFDLEIYSNYSVIFTAFTLSKNRIGFYLRSSSFRMGIYTHMMFYNPSVPISRVYLQMARLVGCSIPDFPELIRLSGNVAGIRNSSRKYIVINPNASDLRLERRWGKEKFILLTQRLLENYSEYDICFVGSGSEKSYTEEITRNFQDQRVINLAGTTSIEELIGLIEHADLIITNDTGPMHIAFCTQTPAVCLFGPCSPDQYGAMVKAVVIYKKVYCSPCVHEFETPPCRGNNVCMQLIQVEEVLAGVKQILEEEMEFKKAPKVVYDSDSLILGTVNRKGYT